MHRIATKLFIAAVLVGVGAYVQPAKAASSQSVSCTDGYPQGCYALMMDCTHACEPWGHELNDCFEEPGGTGGVCYDCVCLPAN